MSNIIPLEKQVVDRETAEKLLEMGFPLEGNFKWFRKKRGSNWTEWAVIEIIFQECAHHKSTTIECFPTYALAEVLSELPKRININDDSGNLNVYSLIIDCHSKCIRYECMDADGSIQTLGDYSSYFNDKINMSTAAAKLWIWGKENGHIGGVK